MGNLNCYYAEDRWFNTFFFLSQEGAAVCLQQIAPNVSVAEIQC